MCQIGPPTVRATQNLRAALDLDGDRVAPADYERDCPIALEVAGSGTSRTVNDDLASIRHAMATRAARRADEPA